MNDKTEKDGPEAKPCYSCGPGTVREAEQLELAAKKNSKAWRETGQAIAKVGGWKSAQHLFNTYLHADQDPTITDRLFDTEPKDEAKNG